MLMCLVNRARLVLLCGPVTRDIFDVALAELRMSMPTFPAAG